MKAKEQVPVWGTFCIPPADETASSAIYRFHTTAVLVVASVKKWPP